MTSRPRNPRGEGKRLRDQLLAATAEVLNEVGDADRVSVRAIARRAGVSPTALYLQFPDRDSLVTAAVDAGFDTFNDELTEAPRSPGTPARTPPGDGPRLPRLRHTAARALLPRDRAERDHPTAIAMPVASRSARSTRERGRRGPAGVAGSQRTVSSSRAAGRSTISW